MNNNEQINPDHIDKLVCPKDQTKLTVTGNCDLRCTSCNTIYPLRDGIFRFLGDVEPGQKQVLDGFDFKWNRDAWGFAPEHRKVMGEFFRNRFKFASDEDVGDFFSGKTVLHAGVGNGQDEQYYLHHCKEVWGADISTSVDALRENWANHYPDLANRFKTCQANLMALPFEDGAFDIVLSDGVLHHTPDTFKALEAITKKVKAGGFVMFYIYVKKAPIREFVDDYLRDQISNLSPKEAWKALEPLTALAKEFSEKGLEINVPEDFGLLGFEKGDFNLQRWMYWNFLKFYWNDAFTFDENNHVNYDWYYPVYAWRHTVDDVRGWLLNLGLEENLLNVTDSGISVIAKKGD